jgi:hypothetical protein|tara:strand:- start:270 stop:572 length:303 start_codon:yes stop_codon:yes gene_type:complete
MDINTHGFEKEENEHAGVKQVYNDITPRKPQSEMVVALKKMAGDKYLFKCIDSFEWKAAEYIIELEQQLRNEKEINAHLWKSLAQVEKQRDHISEELSKR